MLASKRQSTLGDPCTISCQEELNESVRLFDSNHDTELTLHSESASPFFCPQGHTGELLLIVVFDALPPAPGLPCEGEDRTRMALMNDASVQNFFHYTRICLSKARC